MPHSDLVGRETLSHVTCCSFNRDHPRMRALLAKAGSHVAAARGLPNRKSCMNPAHHTFTDATIFHYDHPISTAESYQLSELPDGYALFLMKRKTETGTTAGRIKAETAIFVRLTLPFLPCPRLTSLSNRDRETLRNLELFPSFCSMWIGCWTQAMICKTTALVNARSLPHHQKHLRALPQQLLQLKPRARGGNGRPQIL